MHWAVAPDRLGQLVQHESPQTFNLNAPPFLAIARPASTMCLPSWGGMSIVCWYSFTRHWHKAKHPAAIAIAIAIAVAFAATFVFAAALPRVRNVLSSPYLILRGLLDCPHGCC